jgi:mono/diheme cytochrome c family protein/choline kinase
MHTLRLVCLGTGLVLAQAVAQTADSNAGEAFYEQTVRPILRTNCYACHTDKNVNSGLSVETRESLLKGGNRGAVVEPGAPEKSLLIKALRHEGDVKMPPGKKLDEAKIAAVEQWVKDGMQMPEKYRKAKRPGADHWAFQAPKRAPLPEVKNAQWARNAVDRWVLAKIEAANLTPSPEADKATLLRRVSLDLIGLPPTREELHAFLADTRPDAYERVVDRLLASPHFGERWARDWLDMARYADTDGYTIDAPRDMWPYRDWVIHAMNADMPFDRFVIEQFAGDLLPNATRDQIIATGFHRNTPSNYEGGIDFEQYRVEAVADRVNTTGAVFLGLTMGCARCHDHKYDPVSQREYYQMFAFLNNVDEIDKEADRKYFNRPFLDIGTEEQIAQYNAWEEKVKDLEDKINIYIGQFVGDAEKDEKLKAMRKEASALRRKKPPVVRALVMRDRTEPRQSYIHLGGDFLRKGATVEPGVPAAGLMPPLTLTGEKPTRLDLAKWLVRPDHPLTARVTMNRLWQRYFGRGIVDTENDLGTQGDKPTHPELLDHLALEFVQGGWSMKAMHRMIVTSATYRQASRHRKDAAAVDPDNRLLARQNRLRLDAELIRDASLVASGLFAAKVGGPSVYPPIPAGANSVTQVKRDWNTATGEDRYRRGMYTYFQRSAGHPGLIVFDAPDGSVSCTRRVRSNTPLQALTLLNDEAHVEFAAALSARVRKEAATDAERLKLGYLYALAREPRPAEQERFLRFIQARRDAVAGGASDEKVWNAAARALLNLDEFMTRE